MARRNSEGTRILSNCPFCGVDVYRLEKHMNELCLARPLPGQAIRKGTCPHCRDDVGVECLNAHLMHDCPLLTVPCPFCNERHRQIQQHLNRRHKKKQNHPAFTSVRKPPNPYKCLKGTIQDNDTIYGSLKVIEFLISDEPKQVTYNSDANDDSVRDEEYIDVDILSNTFHEFSLDTDFGKKKYKNADQPANLKYRDKSSNSQIRCQQCGDRILLARFAHHVNNKCLARPLPGQSIEPGHCPHCLRRVRLNEMSGHLMYECDELTVSCPFCQRRFRQIRQHLNAKHKNKSHLPEFLNTTKIPNPYKILLGECLNVPEPNNLTTEKRNITVYGNESSGSDAEIDYESFLIRPPKLESEN